MKLGTKVLINRRVYMIGGESGTIVRRPRGRGDRGLVAVKLTGLSAPPWLVDKRMLKVYK